MGLNPPSSPPKKCGEQGIPQLPESKEIKDFCLNSQVFLPGNEVLMGFGRLVQPQTGKSQPQRKIHSHMENKSRNSCRAFPDKIRASGTVLGMWLLRFPRFLKQIPNFSLGDSFPEQEQDGTNKFQSFEFPFQALPAQLSSTGLYPGIFSLENPRTSPFLIISAFLDKTHLYPGNISLENPGTATFFSAGLSRDRGRIQPRTRIPMENPFSQGDPTWDRALGLRTAPVGSETS